MIERSVILGQFAGRVGPRPPGRSRAVTWVPPMALWRRHAPGQELQVNGRAVVVEYSVQALTKNMESFGLRRWAQHSGLRGGNLIWPSGDGDWAIDAAAYSTKNAAIPNSSPSRAYWWVVTLRTRVTESLINN